MADSAFNQALVWLSDKISEEELPCLQFIASSILKKNHFDKSTTDIFNHLKTNKLIAENNFSILYDTLGFMGRLDLQVEFRKKFEGKIPKQKSQEISSFTRMLIDVCKHVSVSSGDWKSFLFLYRQEEGGARIDKGCAYACLQYLLDRDILRNDKFTLSKFKGVLEGSGLIQSKKCVEQYLKENKTLPEEIKITPERSSPIVAEAFDGHGDGSSANNISGYNISGNHNLILIDSTNPIIRQALGNQPHSGKKNRTKQDTLMKNQQTMDSEDKMNQHQTSVPEGRSMHLKPEIDDQTDQQELSEERKPRYSMDQATGTDPQSPMHRQEGIKGQMSETDNQDSGIQRDLSIDSFPKPLSSLNQPTDLKPTPPTAEHLCADKKCYRFSKDEIAQMKREEKKIGKGGFGTVYKGRLILPSGQESLVAIKEYSEDIAKSTGQGDKQFEKELDAVNISKHCFAVTVIGYCLDGEYKALVYPYMEKGDLKNLIDNCDPALTWQVRLRILHQISRAMCHFHNSFKKRNGQDVIHGDIKDDNIFVDNNFNAFLGDFGVAEEIAEEHTHITRIQNASALGYKDPDNIGHFTRLSDIFQFGVLMFRCLTSKPAKKDGKRAECESLAPAKERYLPDCCEDLCQGIDKNIWEEKCDMANELARFVVNECLVSSETGRKRCSFKDIFIMIDKHMKEEDILPFANTDDTLCICCRIQKPIDLDPKCGCNFRCPDCIRNSSLSCPCTPENQ